ncbi:MAG: hypothetical protein Ct9H300mP27_10620 [Chloroflexota bacterium]|nr:MAG: hypothetical protein Ct9H300mP27_10620 [Chloroflexota bacterium]
MPAKCEIEPVEGISRVTVTPEAIRDRFRLALNNT